MRGTRAHLATIQMRGLVSGTTQITGSVLTVAANNLAGTVKQTRWHCYNQLCGCDCAATVLQPCCGCAVAVLWLSYECDCGAVLGVYGNVVFMLGPVLPHLPPHTHTYTRTHACRRTHNVRRGLRRAQVYGVCGSALVIRRCA